MSSRPRAPPVPDAECIKMVQHLRSNVPLRVGYMVEEQGRRQRLYFKGEKMIRYLIENNPSGMFEDIKEKDDAEALGAKLLKGVCEKGRPFFRRVEVKKKEKSLSLSKSTSFEADGYYVWIYEAPPTTFHVALLVVIGLAVLAICMFPVWPIGLRIAAWYFLVSILLLLLGTLFIRVALYFALWLVGFDFWILPNVLDDNASVSASFVPLVSFAVCKEPDWMWRAAAWLCVVGVAYWVYTQPTEFDEYIAIQRQFVSDLYSGTLLSETSQVDKDNIDKPKEPSMADILFGPDAGSAPPTEADEYDTSFMDELIAKELEAEDVDLDADSAE